MERPALQRLLADIRERLVDVIVVYKIDRLTRSLADFAKMVELFDAHGISFVSVTQQFNTTTSMGRLTLNVLLSFAQFEREVTGERIRDKIAASKRKGMWMGGIPPLGYDVYERRLVVNPAEAETVRGILRRYGELGCVRLLKNELDRAGIVQFAVDPWRSPPVLLHHASNHLAQLLVGSGPSRFAAEVTPVGAIGSSVPGDDGGRFHNRQGAGPVGPDLPEADPERPIDRDHFRAPATPNGDGELLPEGEVLQNRSRISASRRCSAGRSIVPPEKPPSS